MAKLSKHELREAILGDESLSEDVKGQLLDLLKTPTFGLVWEEKTEDVIERLRDELPILKEVKERAIISEDEDAPNHVLIEADNLEALVALTYTHEGKFDVIYIDPPYNTGATIWKYNNDYIDGNDDFRHSKWISLIYHRIKIARHLLKATGIIAVTIDDYEVASLKLLMDSVFGEDNYIGTIVIRNNPSGRSTVRGLSVNHEYALIYSNTSAASLGRLNHNDEQKSRYSEKDEVGYFEWENFRKNGTDSDRKDRPKQYYPIVFNERDASLRIPEVEWSDETKSYRILDSLSIDDIVLYPKQGKTIEKVWKYGIERARTIVDDIKITRTKTGIELYRKKYLNIKGSLPHTWWDKPSYSARDNGTRTLTNIFGPTKVFDFPKAPEAVKDALISANLQKDGLVLDFFAGSGTTMHATMMLNQEDGGHRQCFLVTNNESKICEEVTYERNKRVIQGYTTPKGEPVAGLTRNSLRYYKIEHTPRKHTHENKMLLAQAMTEMLQIKWNAYDEPERFGSLRVKPRYMRYFNGDEDVLIIYVPEIIPYIVKEIKAMDNSKKLHVYVAADGNYAYSEEFGEVMKRIELASIPSAYYNAIKSILPAPTEEKGEYVPSEEDEELLAHADKHDFQD